MSIVNRPEFAGIRPDLLNLIRDWEVVFATAREEALSQLPADFREMLAPIVAPAQESYIAGLLPFWKQLSKMMDETDILRQRMKGAFN